MLLIKFKLRLLKATYYDISIDNCNYFFNWMWFFNGDLEFRPFI